MRRTYEVVSCSHREKASSAHPSSKARLVAEKTRGTTSVSRKRKTGPEHGAKGEASSPLPCRLFRFTTDGRPLQQPQIAPS